MKVSKVESIEKLRYPSHEMTGAECNRIADAIQAEIDSRYMLLPVDADGVPIRVGDEPDSREKIEADAVSVLWRVFDAGAKHDCSDGEPNIGAWMVRPLLDRQKAITEHDRKFAALGHGTCQVDETGTYFAEVHDMECRECGHTYEHVNGDYEFCPRCGREVVSK